MPGQKEGILSGSGASKVGLNVTQIWGEPYG